MSPDLIFILSGKRKSGKDYIANFLLERFGTGNSVIIRLSGPLKERYALVRNLVTSWGNAFMPGIGEKEPLMLNKHLESRVAVAVLSIENNLDYEKLLDSSEYKETFRQKMIEWGENIRNKDPGYFCRHAIQQSKAESKKIWIVSDARRKTDVQYFKQEYPDAVYTVRIKASESVRKDRGWVFTKGVDDIESECGLDDYAGWSFQICNDSHEQMLEVVNQILQLIPSILTSTSSQYLTTYEMVVI